MKWATAAVAVLASSVAFGQLPQCTLPPIETLKPKAPNPSPHVGPAWFTAATYGDAIRERERTGKPLFLLFTNPATCPHCRALEAGALASRDVRLAMEGFVCVRIDTGKPESRDLVNFYGTDGIPRMMVYVGRYGGPAAFAGELTGNVSAGSLLELLKANPQDRPAAVVKPAKFTNGFNCGASFCGAQGGPGCSAAGRTCPNSAGGTCVCGR